VLNQRIAGVLERNSAAANLIVMIGVNDAGGTSFTPSGTGCSGPACNETFKGNVQAVVNQAATAGKTILMPLTPPRFGDALAGPYPDPASHPRNLLIRDEYNHVIANEITDIALGPDFYDYFLGSQNRFDLYATNLHPNALGYQVMAQLIANAITGGSTPPAVAGNFCVRLIQGSACQAPLTYKQNLMEPGNRYYVDAPFTVIDLPAALVDGRFVLTANADRNATNDDYLTFELPGSSSVYVAWDANATVPAWLAGFTATGDSISTDDPAAPTLDLYRQDAVAGTVQLGGAASGSTGAAANYIVIVVVN
jgi:hypothetical protein